MTRLRVVLPLLVGLVMAPAALAGPAAATKASFPPRIDLPDGWRPEGITAGRGHTVFVGSLADGAIWRADVRTGEGGVFVPGVTGQVAVGTEYEHRADRLWAAGGATGAVRVYDAGSGALLQTYQFTPGGFLNDLVATRDAVYVTDSPRQQLWKIPLGQRGELPDPSQAVALPLTGDLVVTPGAFNLNGIVATPWYLVAVQSNTGLLFRIDPRTGVTKQIDTGGLVLGNGDGLELVGRTLYVVRNQVELVEVLFLWPFATKAAHLGTIAPDPAIVDVPTTVAFQSGRLWAANARFSTPPTPETEYWITQLSPFPTR